MPENAGKDTTIAKTGRSVASKSRSSDQLNSPSFPVFDVMPESSELDVPIELALSGSHPRGTQPGAKSAPSVSNKADANRTSVSEEFSRESNLTSMLGTDYSRSTFERHAALLGHKRLRQPMYAARRMVIARKLQRDYGNGYVQRLVQHLRDTSNDRPSPTPATAGLSETEISESPSAEALGRASMQWPSAESELRLHPFDEKPGLLYSSQVTGPVAQRMNLEQAGWAGGLAKANAKLLLMGDARQVNVYNQTAAATVGSRVDALKKAGEMSATVGKLYYQGIPVKKKFTPLGKNLDDATYVAKVDPFHFEATVKIQQGKKEKELSLRFQHAAAYTGYVTGIKDATNPAIPQGQWSTMEDPAAIKKVTDKYGMQHQPDDPDKANAIAMTSGGAEKNLDAYTKIAGEGARWQCIRNHAAQLRNDSFFYTDINKNNNDPAQLKGIKFETLYTSWASIFKKKYNIPDGEVTQNIQSDEEFGYGTFKTKPVVVVPAPKDYNLDTHAGYVTAVV